MELEPTPVRSLWCKGISNGTCENNLEPSGVAPWASLQNMFQSSKVSQSPTSRHCSEKHWPEFRRVTGSSMIIGIKVATDKVFAAHFSWSSTSKLMDESGTLETPFSAFVAAWEQLSNSIFCKAFSWFFIISSFIFSSIIYQPIYELPRLFLSAGGCASDNKNTQTLDDLQVVGLQLCKCLALVNTKRAGHQELLGDNHEKLSGPEVLLSP